MNNKVIAIIVTYNRKELLKQVLIAVKGQSYPLEKIIIVDNNSSDGTYDYISELLSDIVLYENTGGNLGGAGGFHFGFKCAEKYEYDYLWLMDDDFSPTEYCLEHLLDGNPQGITQPLRFNLDESCAELSPLSYNLSNPFVLNPKGIPVKDYLESNKNNEEQLLEIETVPFEGPLISKSVIDVIGFPEPRFFIFGDDTDYSIRAKRKGFAIQCNLKAKAYRLLVNNQKNDLLSWKGYFMLRNLFYLHKTYGLNFCVRNKPIILAVGYTVTCLLKGRFSQSKIIWRAFWDSTTLSNSELFKPGVRK